MRSILQTILLGGLACVLHADLKPAKDQPNLEKRSDLALENAEELMKACRTRYQAGEWNQVLAALNEIRESVDLSFAALQETGKSARKNPKYFKRAELKTRELARKLESFSREVGIDDRPEVEKVKDRVQQVHEELLLGIMSKKN